RRRWRALPDGSFQGYLERPIGADRISRPIEAEFWKFCGDGYGFVNGGFPIADASSRDKSARLVSRFRSSHHCAAPLFANFGIEGHWQLIDLVWLWFRSPHDEPAAGMMRTSEPPH